MRKLTLVLVLFGSSAWSRAEDEEKPVPESRTHSVEAGAIAVAPGTPESGITVGTAAAPGKKSPDWERLPIVARPGPASGGVPGAGGINILGVASWSANSGPPKGSSCKVPPPNMRIALVIHNNPEPGKYILDSTPKVCDRVFCDTVGYTGRSCCPAGPEGSPERVSCELYMLGVDPTDGVAGPHWMFVGSGTIKRHNNNPFLAVLHVTGGGGTAYVCNNRQPTTCTTLKVP